MLKKVISTFLYVAFLLFITTPTILMIVESTTDASIIFSLSEEEEKSSEKELNIKVLLSVTVTNDQYLFSRFTKTNLVHISKKYYIPHLNIISPPPELLLF